MRKTLTFLLMTAVVTVFYCGCSDGDSQSGTAEETTAVQTTADTETKPPVNLFTMLSSSDEARQNYDYDFVAIKQKSEEITDSLNEITSKTGFNGSVYLKLGNDFEYFNSKGYANIGDHVSNSITTCFYTGSFTRQLTAAAVLRLAEEKKLDLDDTLDSFFPSYEYGEEISVRDLLSSKPALKSYIVRDNSYKTVMRADEDILSELSADNSADENKEIILDWILDQKPVQKSDIYYSDLDSDYFVLGEIISQSSETDYEEYISEIILEPLGMKSYGFKPNEKLASAYQGDFDRTGLRMPGAGYSSFGLISSVSDITKWVDGLLGGEVIGEKSLDLMLGGKDTPDGYGVVAGKRYISSFGKTDSYSAKVAYTRDESEIYIGLTSYAYSSPSFLHRKFSNYLSKYKI
ncbi:MAG: beta-lactamase family protein [Ruminococcus sp.]|nr:beta-lactamase family protein [Ruminococcus sp.]